MAQPILAQHGIPEPPGELLEVNGHLLHLDCRGEGSPTVVYEAGMGGWSLDWERVHPSIAATTRSCAYDRAGMGWSEPSDAEMTTSKDIAEELHELLSKAGEEGPYLMVAHSLGGFHQQVFAHQFPDEVIGAVLVDASHEEQFLWEAPTYWDVPPPDEIPEEPEFDLDLIDYRPETVSLLLAMREEPKWGQTTSREGAGIRDSVLQLREFDHLPNIPLIVLTAGEEKQLESYWRPDELSHNQGQRDLVSLSPRSIQIHVPGANHYLHLGRPDVVIASILRIVAIARELVPDEKLVTN